METRTFPMEIVSGMDGFAQRFPTDRINNKKRRIFQAGFQNGAEQNYQNISFNGRPLFLLRILD